MKKSKALAEAITYACVGNGASLTMDDLALLNREDVRVIVVNDVFQWAPWAYALYSADYRWWKARIDDVRKSAFRGRLLALDETAVADFKLEYVHCEDLQKPLGGIAPDRNSIRHGYSGGFQALHIARNCGATRVLLLGYDYGATGQGRAAPAAFGYSISDFATMTRAFDVAAPLYAAEGVDVVNCSRETALTCFRRAPIAEALA